MESLEITQGLLNLDDREIIDEDIDEEIGFCEDCGRHAKLVTAPACVDYQWAGNICCSKMVCEDYCIYECSSGHSNEVYNDDGWIYELTCSSCSAKWEPEFKWWGLSIYEYRRRYD
jgi:hypothetical protein